ncbi:MAG: hypothetical protein IPO52_13555 [Gemmatimonadetes bacterium]|nr:hypothetical protein [Gemmatimonadota bacterium]MBK9550093.1 hypothetical protein [Gemmatimonadota bacterium]
MLRYLWPSPLSLVGMLIATACRAPLRRRDHTLEACGGLLPRFLPRIGFGMRPAAITLGHVILAVDQPTLDQWRDHERVHVAQAERWGPLFPVAYAAASAVAWGRGKDPYRDNFFELEAQQVSVNRLQV